MVRLLIIFLLYPCFTNGQIIKDKTEGIVHFMIEDRDGNIWIGTRNTGLYKYDIHLNDKAGQEKRFINFSE